MQHDIENEADIENVDKQKEIEGGRGRRSTTRGWGVIILPLLLSNSSWWSSSPSPAMRPRLYWKKIGCGLDR